MIGVRKQKFLETSEGAQCLDFFSMNGQNKECIAPPFTCICYKPYIVWLNYLLVFKTIVYPLGFFLTAQCIQLKITNDFKIVTASLCQVYKVCICSSSIKIYNCASFSKGRRTWNTILSFIWRLNEAFFGNSMSRGMGFIWEGSVICEDLCSTVWCIFTLVKNLLNI